AFVDAECFLAEPDGLFNAAPITGLAFWVPGPLAPRVLACPALRRVRRLRFLSGENRFYSATNMRIRLGAGDFRQIAECPHLDHLRELGITSQRIPADEVAALVSSPHLAQLETLRLTGDAIDGDGYDMLGSRLALPSLRHLDLTLNDGARLACWRAAKWPSQLRTLDLGLSDL